MWRSYFYEHRKISSFIIKLGRQSCLDPDDTVEEHMNKNQVKTFLITLGSPICLGVGLIVFHMSGWMGGLIIFHMSGWMGLQKGKLSDGKD